MKATSTKEMGENFVDPCLFYKWINGNLVTSTTASKNEKKSLIMRMNSKICPNKK